MASPSTIENKFAGSIPELYDHLFVPLIFEHYAADIAERVRARAPSRILEIAAGTGAVTRALASATPATTSIVATDLNQAMLDRAAAVGTSRPVTWRQADAMQLPFPDDAFDAVVCGFGAMFFPDKAQAYAETRRVLAPGGFFIFSVWDRIADNEFADVVTTSLASAFPADPPRFMARTPHGYHDADVIVRDLAGGGFTAKPELCTIAARSRAASPRIVAMAYCQGTPIRNEIEARDAARLDEATDVAAAAVAARFGHRELDSKIQAHVVIVRA